MNALASRPPIFPETSRLLDAYHDIKLFVDINSYCDFFAIKDIDDRAYLLRMCKFIQRVYNSEK